MDLEQEAKEYADSEVPFDTTESGEKLYTKFDVEYAYIQGAKKNEVKLEEAKEIIKDLINLYHEYPFHSEVRLQSEWNEDKARIKKAQAFLK